MSRTSLRSFLATARAALAAPAAKRPKPLTFVVGNESADLDSLCSAVLLAYVRSQIPPHSLHIPLCNIPRDDLTLRPEFKEVLRYAAASPDDLVTLSELPGPEDLEPADTRWLLVDHNVLTGRLGELYSEQITGCIDHHVDEGKLPKGANPCVIEKVGSCASLVVEQCKDTWKTFSGESLDKDSARIDAQLSYLALAPVLIDTTNLQDETKTTPPDEEVVEYLEAKIREAPGGDDGQQYDRNAFYEKISSLKEDISPLSIRDILRKDYKEWAETGAGAEGHGDSSKLKLGTSSVSQTFQFLVDKAEGVAPLVRELDLWGEERQLDLVAILTATRNNGKFQRELMLWARTSEAAVYSAKFFESKNSEELKLSTWGNGSVDADGAKEGWIRCWQQGALGHSRKQIAPMLRDAMKARPKL